MELEEALEIVSYKLGVKNGVEALDDPILNEDIVRQAIADDESGKAREIETKDYMIATKLVNAHRQQHYKEEGQAWLAENAKKEGVVVTDSGLQYKVITEGDGAQPTEDSMVVVDYEGTFTDGRPFDSSYESGEPISFPVGGVIKGWQEGIQLMKEGAKYQLYIPYDLAYGERGAGSDIPPYSVLIFDVELHEVS